MTQQNKVSSELTHHGVKGMKWGVKRAPKNSAYSSHHQESDKKLFGRGGVRRINKRMNKGQDHATAKRNEKSYRVKRRVALVGAYYASGTILHYGQLTKGSIAQRAQTKRGQAAAAASMGLPYKPTNGPTYSKKKNGAYKVTTL